MLMARQRTGIASEQMARMYQDPGLAWLEWQAEVIEQVKRSGIVGPWPWNHG